MRFLSQVISISLMNLRNIPQRWGPSIVIVVGIAGVVTVLVAMLAMAKGFETTLQSAGHDDRVIVMSAGSESEMTSGLTIEQANIIENKPGILRIERNSLMAREIYVIADIRKRGSSTSANLPMRGIDENSSRIRSEMTIVAGRDLEFGRFEIIAGESAASQFQGLEIGNSVPIRGADWEVVGLFSTGGSVFESEVWVDQQILGASLNRGPGFSSVTVQLQSPQDFDAFVASLESDRRLPVNAVRESEYYAGQSENLTQLITIFGYAVAAIMAIGAIFAALNTMYSAVATRSVEIATLRALGFGRAPIVISVMLEALLLALLGGVVGSVLTYFVFNGYTVSTLGDSFSQVSFDFRVTSDLLMQGIVGSCILGILGGLLPAVSAARQPITVALRGT
ncbi:MAG: ABC transporter permease [Proteobacteria bacterium]|nr:ABC transporter permease [Pseudomonadota bacterium]